MNRIKSRPLGVGTLRAFEAVARRANFRAAGEELHLTQPAVSRQIRSLEDELGAPLFLRGTRHVELTGAGDALLRVVAPALERLDAAVRQIRSQQARRHVTVTTFASFASLWLLPRLQDFQRQHPGVDIRISAVDTLTDADDPEFDLALRYCHPRDVPVGSQPLFGEVLTPVASPVLLQGASGLPWTAADLARHTLIEEDGQQPSSEFLSWRYWLARQAAPGLEPQRWIYLNFTYQQIQAALAGQGVALARLALVHEPLQRGELVEPFGVQGRVGSPFGYWMVPFGAARSTAELRAFAGWVLEQASLTRLELGDTKP